MPLTLTDLRRIAADVAAQQDPALEVVAATPAEGESTYVEVILTIRGCQVEPCRVMIGVNRNASEREVRRVVKARLQQHIAEHRSKTSP
jgi:hypothetical protein